MILISPECFPCFLRQADLAARAHGASEAVRTALAGRISGMLAGAPDGEVPARIATRLQETVRKTIGTDDPFRQVKAREIGRFAEMAERAEAAVAASADPWRAALGMAAFGNIMDSGILERRSMEGELSRFPDAAHFPEPPQRLREAIERADTVGVLLDNAGEAAFDVPLLSRLAAAGKRLWIGVKGGAVIDDLTEEEARRIGLSAFGEIVSNGNRGVGTDLSLCPPPFRARIERSDLILSKGQANFETLYGAVRHAFFLFRCKCPVVSRALGRPEGALVILDGAEAQ